MKRMDTNGKSKESALKPTDFTFKIRDLFFHIRGNLIGYNICGYNWDTVIFYPSNIEI